LQQLAFDNTAHPLAAAILITDGGHNAGRDPRELAPSLSGTGLHIVPIGNTKMERDVILHHTHAPKVVLQNDNVVIESGITAYDCAKESLQIELLEGEKGNRPARLLTSRRRYSTRRCRCAGKRR
jgi:hypothetical protein